MSSRKLAGAIAAMLCIVGTVLGAAVIGGVPDDVLLTGISLIAGLGGFQIMRQAHTDDLRANNVPKVFGKEE